MNQTTQPESLNMSATAQAAGGALSFPPPAAFAPERAGLLCRASADAYDAQCLEARGEGEPIMIGNRLTDTLALVIPQPDGQIIAFRGTRDVRNWLTDMDCAFAREDGLRLHRGFVAALDSILPQLEAAIRPGKIWITGHSLGGALAMLFAWRMRRSFTPAGVYTFGQPRVGDRVFSCAYEALGLKALTWRVVHGADVVPRVPWLLGSYRHAGHEVFYPSLVGPRCRAAQILGGDAAPPYLVDLPPWRKLLFEAPELLHEWTHPRLALLADHHFNNYLRLFPAVQSACSALPTPNSSLL